MNVYSKSEEVSQHTTATPAVSSCSRGWPGHSAPWDPVGRPSEWPLDSHCPCLLTPLDSMTLVNLRKKGRNEQREKAGSSLCPGRSHRVVVSCAGPGPPPTPCLPVTRAQTQIWRNQNDCAPGGHAVMQGPRRLSPMPRRARPPCRDCPTVRMPQGSVHTTPHSGWCSPGHTLRVFFSQNFGKSNNFCVCGKEEVKKNS